MYSHGRSGTHLHFREVRRETLQRLIAALDGACSLGGSHSAAEPNSARMVIPVLRCAAYCL